MIAIEQRKSGMATNPVLGIIATETPPDLFPGSLHHPDTFQCGVISEFVKGVSAGDMINAPPGAERSVVDAAVALVERGATHITSNCGYTVLYLDILRRSVDVPLFVSSLQLLPTLVSCRADHKRVGILTYDAPKLSEKHLSAALGGLYDSDTLVICGMEGSAAWSDWQRPSPEYDFDTARRDILDAANELLLGKPACILMECEVMIPFARIVKAETRLPVYDLVSTLKFLFDLRSANT
jgi:hypothetical protein